LIYGDIFSVKINSSKSIGHFKAEIKDIPLGNDRDENVVFVYSKGEFDSIGKEMSSSLREISYYLILSQTPNTLIFSNI
jgi:hypothetical protein